MVQVSRKDRNRLRGVDICNFSYILKNDLISPKASVKVLVTQLCPILCRPPWTVALQAPLSMGFSRQEYWSGLPCPSPGDLPDPRMEPGSPALQKDSLLSKSPRKLQYLKRFVQYIVLAESHGFFSLLPLIKKNLLTMFGNQYPDPNHEYPTMILSTLVSPLLIRWKSVLSLVISG